jgi:hypothetical protein
VLLLDDVLIIGRGWVIGDRIQWPDPIDPRWRPDSGHAEHPEQLTPPLDLAECGLEAGTQAATRRRCAGTPERLAKQMTGLKGMTL